MKANYVHKDTLTATDYVELNKNYELLVSYNQSLLKENQELKQKYENAVADYETTMAEKEQLKKQLKDKTEDYKRMKDNFDSKVDVLTEIDTQQKEFIKWLENGIEKVKNTEFLDERIQRAGLIAYNRCLRKYKSIIGASDENN